MSSLLLLVLLLSSCATTERYTYPDVLVYQGGYIQARPFSGIASLKVMTLNVAHGRGTGFHQLLQQSIVTVRNLDNIAALLNDVEPDILALQEADAPSFWSGKFNHVEHLAGSAGFARSVQASHIKAMGLAYGTALLSRLELLNPQAVSFSPSPSSLAKGFVVSTIHWPGEADIEIDVVSVHLDFMSAATRKKQADELIAVLQGRTHPLIVMGDLNSSWQQQDSVAKYLVNSLELKAFQPENTALVTFPTRGERLDWILVSHGIRFASHDVIGRGISDHRGVVAELILSDQLAAVKSGGSQ